MNSVPGTLRGSGIRPLPPAMLDRMLRRIKEHGSGKSRRLRSARYRVTGFRDPNSGQWVSRNPRNGHYYRMRDGRHTTKVRPTVGLLKRSDMLALEVEIDRGKGARIYYVSIPGLGRSL